MEIAVEHEAFTDRGLVVRAGGLWKGPQLILDGEPVRRKRRVYKLRDNSGLEVEARFKTRFLDPIPQLEIDGRTIELARPLTWYEYTWMGLPVLLVFGGGALGAFFGIGAFYSSARIFRSERGPSAKYLLSGLISVCAVVLFLAFAVVLQLLVYGVPHE